MWNSSLSDSLLPSNETTVQNAKDGLVSIIVATFLVLISTTSVFGNALIITAIYLNHNLRTSANLLFGNLALSDFLQGAITVPLRLVEILRVGSNIRSLCRASITISIIFGGSSNLSILFISLERFIGVRWPFLYYSFVTTEVVFAAVAFAWLSVAIFAILPLFAWGGLDANGAHFCRFPLFLTSEYITALFLFINIIPICVVVPLYFYILRASLRSIRRIQVLHQGVRSRTCDYTVDIDETDPESNKAPIGQKKRTTEAARQLKSAKTVSMVVGLFILLCMPIAVIDAVEMLGGPSVHPWMIKIAVGMVYANHCVNVFVYAGCNSDYKRTFVKILSKCKNYVLSKCNSFPKQG